MTRARMAAPTFTSQAEEAPSWERTEVGGRTRLAPRQAAAIAQPHAEHDGDFAAPSRQLTRTDQDRRPQTRRALSVADQDVAQVRRWGSGHARPSSGSLLTRRLPRCFSIRSGRSIDAQAFPLRDARRLPRCRGASGEAPNGKSQSNRGRGSWRRAPAPRANARTPPGCFFVPLRCHRGAGRNWPRRPTLPTFW